MDPNILNTKINKDYFVIFGLSYCQYCKNAKIFLKENNQKYKYYEIDQFYNTFLNTLKQTQHKYPNINFDIKHKTFPIIFYKGKFIGGYTDLLKYKI